MNKRKITKLAKENGYNTAEELIADKCPSEVGGIDDFEECGGCYEQKICTECWKKTELISDDDVFTLTRKAFTTDEEYEEYLRRCEETETPEKNEQVNHPEPEDEVWKQIENFALYEISSKGRIRNKETGFIKTPGIGKRGYPVVSMRANGKMYLKTVHRLVANAFIPNPENKSEVNHINGIKTDYSIENLEWTTRRENDAHARRTGLHKSDGDKPVSQYENNGRFVATYRSASEASRQTGIGRANICNACYLRKYNGRTCRTAGGYVWKWTE